jgi:hypothetical protein
MAALRNRTGRGLIAAGSLVLLGIGLFWFQSLNWADRVLLAVIPALGLLWAIHDHGYHKGQADAARRQRG